MTGDIIWQVKTVGASEFKAKCLAFLDDVARTGERVVITMGGKPVALLGPAPAATKGFPQDSIRNKGQIVGDIVAPSTDWHRAANAKL